MSNAFTINNRFTVDPALNIIKDAANGSIARLEPRLINLLCILSANEGSLLSREVLIDKVWNNYGGAEDGLNQAISFLRKALGDEKKKIIETVPKKGYVIHALITEGEIAKSPAQLIATTKGLFSKQYLVVAAVLGTIIFAVVFYFTTHTANNIITGTNSHAKTDSSPEVAFSSLNNPEKETYYNTISTTGPDSTKYRLVAVGDKLPQFYVNDQIVPEVNRDKYASLIDNMLHKLWERQSRLNDSLALNK